MSGIRVEYKGPRFAMVPEWILDAPVSDRAVRLWGILCRYAQGKESCEPTRSELAARLRCSTDSIDRSVRELVEIEAMTVERRPTGQGKRHLPSVYCLDGRERAATNPAGSRTTAATSSRTAADTGSRTTAAQNTERDTPEIKESLSSPPDRFDEFWSTYPKHVGKGAARRAWDRLCRKTDPGVIIEGARRYADSRRGQDPQYTPYPQAWLNAERWTDEPDAPANSNHVGQGPVTSSVIELPA